MKLRYFISALVLCLGIAVSCDQEMPNLSSEVEFEKSFVSIDVNGGTTQAKFTAHGAWQIDEGSLGDWLTATPLSGSEGEATVTFSAEKTKATRTAEVKFLCNNKTQYLNLVQYAQKTDPVVISVADAIAAIKAIDKGDGQSYYLDGEYCVKGIVCKIVEISAQYGNATFYISDDGKFAADKALQIYRGSWLDGKPFTTGKEFALGDEMTVKGELMSYKGTPETVEKTASVVAYKKSLISVTPASFDVPKDETTVVAKVVYSGASIEFTSDASWLTVSSMNKVADTTLVSIVAAENTADARTGVITLKSASGKDASSVTVTINQAAGFAAFPLPYEESFLGTTGGWEIVNVIPVEGVESIWVNDAKYGMKATATAKVTSKAEIISPNIDLSGVSSAVLSFEHVQRFAANVNQELKLFVSKDNGENWEELLIPVYSPGNNWNFVGSGDISLKKFAGNLIQIKFQYNSNANAYATWEIKNLKVVEAEPVITTIAGIIDNTVAAESEFTAHLTDAVVSYVNGGSAFIEDATGGVQLYLSGHTFKAGMKITGKVTGKVKLYNGYAELTGLDASEATVTEGEAPAPKVMPLETLLDCYLRWQNCQVMLEEVTFETPLTTSNRNGKITQGMYSIAAYAQVKNTIEMSGTGNLICWPTRYNANLQVGVWSNDHFATK